MTNGAPQCSNVFKNPTLDAGQFQVCPTLAFWQLPSESACPPRTRSQRTPSSGRSSPALAACVDGKRCCDNWRNMLSTSSISSSHKHTQLLLRKWNPCRSGRSNPSRCVRTVTRASQSDLELKRSELRVLQAIKAKRRNRRLGIAAFAFAFGVHCVLDSKGLTSITDTKAFGLVVLATFGLRDLEACRAS